MKKINTLVKSAIVASIVVNISANEFQDKIIKVFENHNLIKMVDYDLKTSEEQVKSAKGAWYPTITMKSSAGKDSIDREGQEQASYEPYKMSIEARQLIYDFGLTEKRIQNAQNIATKEQDENSLQRQNLLLATVEAQLELIKSNILYKNSKKSEENIKEQTRLENARLEMGKGYSTDVLQSKASLLGAEANRIYTDGQKSVSEYRYKAVFLDESPIIEDLLAFQVSDELLPKDLNEMEALVKKDNPDIIAAKARAKVASSEKDVVVKEQYSPNIYADFSRSLSDEFDGVDGSRNESKAAVNFSWKFNLGLKSNDDINAARFASLSAAEKAFYVEVQAIENARKVWNNLQTSKYRTKYLENQIEIQKQFLSLAKQEREIGRRSLIDILNGESALLKAEAEYAASKIEEILNSFRVLRSIGKLNLDLFKTDEIYVKQTEIFSK